MSKIPSEELSLKHVHLHEKILNPIKLAANNPKPKISSSQLSDWIHLKQESRPKLAKYKSIQTTEPKINRDNTTNQLEN